MSNTWIGENRTIPLPAWVRLSSRDLVLQPGVATCSHPKSLGVCRYTDDDISTHVNTTAPSGPLDLLGIMPMTLPGLFGPALTVSVSMDCRTVSHPLAGPLRPSDIDMQRCL